jgi:hypothetical protein
VNNAASELRGGHASQAGYRPAGGADVESSGCRFPTRGVHAGSIPGLQRMSVVSSASPMSSPKRPGSCLYLHLSEFLRAIPKGLCHPAPGLRGTNYPGSAVEERANSKYVFSLPAPRTAELHSAVSPICNRQRVDSFQRFQFPGHVAGCNPAIRQSATLRYAKREQPQRGCGWFDRENRTPIIS